MLWLEQIRVLQDYIQQVGCVCHGVQCLMQARLLLSCSITVLQLLGMHHVRPVPSTRICHGLTKLCEKLHSSICEA